MQERVDNPNATVLVGGGEGQLVVAEHVGACLPAWLHQRVPPMVPVHGLVQLWLHPVLRCEPLD